MAEHDETVLAKPNNSPARNRGSIPRIPDFVAVFDSHLTSLTKLTASYCKYHSHLCPNVAEYAHMFFRTSTVFAQKVTHDQNTRYIDLCDFAIALSRVHSSLEDQRYRRESSNDSRQPHIIQPRLYGYAVLST
jgi:hypothetical protein